MLDKITFRIAQFGGNSYFVGGYVRDFLLNIITKDIDIVVTNLELLDLERALSPFKPIYCGKTFGVFKVKNFDIALSRMEKSSGIGHTDFEITIHKEISIEDDLKRRDFTINSMAMNITTKEIIDPHNGQTDLKNKIIRQINTTSIPEDYLRALRAIQFAGRLNFSIEENTLSNILKYKLLLSSISAERIQLELNKLLLSRNLIHAFDYLLKTELLGDLFPHMLEIHQSDTKYYHHILNSLELSDENLELRLALLFYPAINRVKQHQHKDCSLASIGTIKNTLNKLKYSNKTISLVSTIIGNQPSNITIFILKKTIGTFGIDITKKILTLYFYNSKISPNNDIKISLKTLLNKADRLVSSGKPLSISNLAINGSDLLLLGIKGKAIGVTLNYLFEIVLKAPRHNTKETLTSLAETFQCSKR